MKARMMWMGAVVGVLALTGCQQRDNSSVMQGQDTQQQQGAEDSRGETGGGGMIPERGVEENAMGGSGTGGGGKPDAGMASDAGTGGSGLESGDELGDTGDQDSNP